MTEMAEEAGADSSTEVMISATEVGRTSGAEEGMSSMSDAEGVAISEGTTIAEVSDPEAEGRGRP